MDEPLLRTVCRLVSILPPEERRHLEINSQKPSRLDTAGHQQRQRIVSQGQQEIHTILLQILRNLPRLLLLRFVALDKATECPHLLRIKHPECTSLLLPLPPQSPPQIAHRCLLSNHSASFSRGLAFLPVFAK